jgi:hypothetical protein
MRVSAASWVEPERFDEVKTAFPPISGCEKLIFGPDLTIEPTTRRAASPTGLDMTIRLPEPGGSTVPEPSQIRDIKIKFPAGLTLNTASADGLEACSFDQVGFGKRENAHCQDAAKLATAEFDVPALPRRMKGAIYLREPEPGHLVRVWIVADDLGAHVKLAGEVELDPTTGQLTSVVLGLPQVPLRETKLLFKSGFRAPLATPAKCGTYFTDYEFVPWSGTPPATGQSGMTIDQGCSSLGSFSPELSAGTSSPAAGKHSPFLFTLAREDGEQNFASLGIALPPGLSAKLAGVALCDGPAAQAGSCPVASRIGSVTTATGYGPAPLWVPQPGKRPTALYLGGPYKGAPLSAIAVVPAQAGPFDLGDVVVRNAIQVDPETAEATISSDPLPQIIQGIPIVYRTIHANLDRPGFSLNPTSCRKRAIDAAVTSTEGATAMPSSPFQAVNCANLGFKPSMSLRLFGGTKRGAHPRLRTVLKARKGDANIRRLVLALPRSEFLDQGHIGTVCTRVQFAADQCPKASIYGHARAVTPLLDDPLEGPIYLRSSNNLLPDIVVALRGLVDVHAVGRIDSIRGGIRASFEAIPDAPISKVVVTMRGGGKGLLINSQNLCLAPSFADLNIRGHNGKTLRQGLRVGNSCGKGGSAASEKSRRGLK